jgi:hypothetical protein
MIDPWGKGKFSMLRGRPNSTVSPVSASTLATERLSGRRPTRSEPESPPSSNTL